jgi:methyl-accepting chemotaxis protein
MGTLAATPLIISGKDAAKLSFLSSELQRNKLYETYFIANIQGDYIITSGAKGNVRDREYFKKVMETGETFVSNPVVSRATGNTVVVVAAPIKEDGKITGLLGGTVLTDDLSRRIAAIKVEQTGYAYLVQGDGWTGYRPSPR